MKTRKLPKLRKIVNKDRKHTYKLKDPQKKRILAINEKIFFESKKTGKSTKKAAIAKKGRFNILRIYRRNKKIDECKKITKDMRYIDKKYKLGKTRDICGQKGGVKKQQFLYNPNNPKKSFDVYIDKNPNDTIPIKYTTVKDVENTIKKLEKLYKAGKYSHKRIWQVGMIMKVRLEAMKKHKKKLYPNAKNVTARFNLANKYFNFLSNRTKEKQQKDRKKMSFKYNMKGGRKTRKRKIKMKEKVVKFEKGPGKKKYTAHIKNISTRKVRKIHFGHKDYQQYRDSTNLKLYTRKNHGDIKRMRRYFSRHSGTKKRGEAIKKEKIKSNGFFNAKILSHIYLW